MPEPCAQPRAAARLARQVDVALAELELSGPQYRVLSYLSLGETQPSKLAPRVGVTRPSITALMDGLVARGLVERQPDADDRRRVRHRLTTAGRHALNAADRSVDDRLRELASFLSPADAKRAIAALTLWNDAMIAALAANREGAGR